MVHQTIPQRVESCRDGTNPNLVCRVPSGWVVLCDMQYLRGYCILLADPVVQSINDLDQTRRSRYLADMVIVGDALLQVTSAYRINYAVLGNSDPFLHAHIVPRFMEEPPHLLNGLPWSYPKEQMDQFGFDLERDKPLMGQLALAIQAKLK